MDDLVAMWRDDIEDMLDATFQKYDKQHPYADQYTEDVITTIGMKQKEHDNHWYFGVKYKDYTSTWIPYLSGKRFDVPELLANFNGRKWTPYELQGILNVGRVFDLEQFLLPRKPVVVDEIWDIDSFEEMTPSVVDLPIKHPFSDEIFLPSEFSSLSNTIGQILAFDRAVNPDYNEYFAYLTVDKRPVLPASTQRRTGAHVDGFQGARVEPKVKGTHSYLVTNALPTEFYIGGIDYSKMDVKIHDFFQAYQELVDNGLVKKWVANPFEIVFMDCYQMHSSVVNNTANVINRTLIRLSMSVREFDRLGNGINPLLPYNIEYVPRNISKELIAY